MDRDRNTKEKHKKTEEERKKEERGNKNFYFTHESGGDGDLSVRQ